MLTNPLLSLFQIITNALSFRNSHTTNRCCVSHLSCDSNKHANTVGSWNRTFCFSQQLCRTRKNHRHPFMNKMNAVFSLPITLSNSLSSVNSSTSVKDYRRRRLPGIPLQNVDTVRHCLVSSPDALGGLGLFRLLSSSALCSTTSGMSSCVVQTGNEG